MDLHYHPGLQCFAGPNIYVYMYIYIYIYIHIYTKDMYIEEIENEGCVHLQYLPLAT